MLKIFKLHVFILILFLFKEIIGWRIKHVDGINPPSDSQPTDPYWTWRYLVRKAGQNLTLQCSRSSNWTLPIEENMALAGFNVSDFQQRIRIEPDGDQSSLLHIQDLKVTDTGMYACLTPDNLVVHDEKLFLYVNGPNLFLDSKNERIAFRIGSRTLIIPCRTTQPINYDKMKLSIDGNSTTSDYHPGIGFSLFRPSFTWSQINNVPFYCKYENKTAKYFVQATEAIKLLEGSNFTMNCSLKNGQSVTIVDGWLTLTCPACNPKTDGIPTQRIIDRLHDENVLKNLSTLNKEDLESSITYSHRVCNWIESMANSSIEYPFPFESKSLESRVSLIVLVGVLIAVLIAIIAILAIFCISKKRETKRKALRDEMNRAKISSQKAITYNQLKQIRQRFIGRGAYGSVYELIGHTRPAVIKYVSAMTKLDSIAEPRLTIEKEFQFLKKLKHPNVVELLGTEVIEGSNKFGIIMEYCSGGTLKRFLSNPNMIYTMMTVIIWGEELFDAVDYMFREHKIVHRDIKPENIFLTEGFSLKIGDFGIAKDIEKTCTASSIGTLRYTSPPQSEQSEKIEDSHLNDVYALGLVLWELVERRLVLSEYGEEGQFNREGFVYATQKMDFDELEIPLCQEEIQDIIQRCTNFDRRARPMAGEILEKFLYIKKNDLFIASLDFVPIEEKEQEEILRPIGFDGTKERISIKSLVNAFSCESLFPPLNLSSTVSK